ncbi:MAG: hypothetical protein ACOC7U_10240 [Spirochaetota bacterium]
MEYKKSFKEGKRMEMKKIMTVTVVLVLGMFVIFGFSQKPEAAESADLSIMGMEIGSSFVYNVDAGDIAPAQYFAINLPVGNNVVGGFTLIDGDGATSLDYSLLKLSYFIGEQKPMGVDVYVGGGGAAPNVSGGVGFFLNLLGKSLEETVSTTLKLKASYILTETVNTSGSFMVSLTGQLGI